MPEERRRLARFPRELREHGRRSPTLAAYRDDWQSSADLHAYLSSRKDDDRSLFVGQRGPLTTKGLREIVCHYAGVPPRRLRHTFAYEYLKANENDLVAPADILGHESLNTTRNDTRRRMEDLEECVEDVRHEKREQQEM